MILRKLLLLISLFFVVSSYGIEANSRFLDRQRSQSLAELEGDDNDLLTDDENVSSLNKSKFHFFLYLKRRKFLFSKFLNNFRLQLQAKRYA